MKALVGALALSGVLAFLAACDYTPHNKQADLARSHDRVMETLAHDTDTTGPEPVYSPSRRATDLLSTQKAASELSCEEFHVEAGQFARAWKRYRDAGTWEDDGAHFEFSFKGCEF